MSQYKYFVLKKIEKKSFPLFINKSIITGENRMDVQKISKKESFDKIEEKPCSTKESTRQDDIMKEYERRREERRKSLDIIIKENMDRTI